MIGEGFFFKGLYYFSSHPQNNEYSQVSAFFSFHQKQLLWNQCLAHPLDIVLTKLMPNLDIRSFPYDTCHLSKSTRLLFMLSSSIANKMFNIVYSDVWGPTIESFDGYKYFIFFVDDFSFITWIYLLKFKSEVVHVFQNFHMLVMTQFSMKIKIL
jgi:hypothetical protein